jgi:F-type H+-transporting ATPase subunit gamma
VKNTQQTTKAMKMVAAAKLRKSQDMLLNLRPYALKHNDLLANLSSGIDESVVETPYLSARPIQKVLYVVITSNRGLAGAFNNAIIQLTEKHIRATYPDQLAKGNVKVLPIGRKGYDFYRRKTHVEVVGGKNHDVFTGLNFDRVNEVAQLVMQGFVDGEWDKVEIAYNEFKNVATQIRRVDSFLPAAMEAEKPKAGATPATKTDYVFEPDAKTIIENLVPQILKVKFYRAVLESNASENGARMVAMDNATENAQELLNKLKLAYNNARQAAITKEILEIVSGANALGG